MPTSCAWARKPVTLLAARHYGGHRLNLLPGVRTESYRLLQQAGAVWGGVGVRVSGRVELTMLRFTPGIQTRPHRSDDGGDQRLQHFAVQSDPNDGGGHRLDTSTPRAQLLSEPPANSSFPSEEWDPEVDEPREGCSPAATSDHCGQAREALTHFVVSTRPGRRRGRR